MDTWKNEVSTLNEEDPFKVQEYSLQKQPHICDP